jgi:uncharacterized membrane-anchored protein
MSPITGRKYKMTGKIIPALIGGLIISSLGAILISFSVGAGEEGGSIGAISFWIFYAYAFFIALRSQSSGRAWKWMMINSSILCFLLPISSMLFTGVFLAEETSGAAEAAGGLIGGAILTSVTGVLGFFLGVVFLIIGLVVGNNKN